MTRRHRLSRAPLYCSFCGKTDREVRRMVTGPDVAICNECVETAREIIAEDEIAAAARAAIANDLNK